MTLRVRLSLSRNSGSLALHQQPERQTPTTTTRRRQPPNDLIEKQQASKSSSSSFHLSSLSLCVKFRAQAARPKSDKSTLLLLLRRLTRRPRQNDGADRLKKSIRSGSVGATGFTPAPVQWSTKWGRVEDGTGWDWSARTGGFILKLRLCCGPFLLGAWEAGTRSLLMRSLG